MNCHAKITLPIRVVAVLVLPLALFAQLPGGTSDLSPARSKAAARSSGPNLNETLTFIRQTLESYGKVVSTNTSTNRNFVWTPSLSADDRCKVEIIIDVQTDDGTARHTYRIDLSTIDPEAVNVSSSPENDVILYAVNLSTTNNARAILWTYRQTAPSDKIWNSDLPEPKIAISISDKGIADRLAKAFSHAATLCGGKASVF
jgi:hypothetical protein